MSDINKFLEKFNNREFENKELSHADLLVLAQLSYIDLTRLYEISKSGKFTDLFDDPSEVEAVAKASNRLYNDRKMFDLLKVSKRFEDVELIDFFESDEREEDGQFAAFTFRLHEDIIVIFRGTDNTFSGWLESLSLSYKEIIPAQKTAKVYLKNIFRKYRGKVIVCGHSKGGNLAVFAASVLDPKYHDRLKAVISYDGPGFLPEFYERSDFTDLSEKIFNYMPQDSIVGRMLNSPGKIIVIKSKAFHFLQHLPHFWTIENGNFVILEDFNDSSNHNRDTLKLWLERTDRDKREQILKALDDIASRIDGDSFMEFSENKLETIKMLKKVYDETDKETFDILKEGIDSFFAISKELKSEK